MASDKVNKKTRKEWRALGFFYDVDDDAKAWTFIGSRAGLLNFRDLLCAYVADPRNALQSEHQHYRPYTYLKVMTWQEAELDKVAIRGPLADLARLAELVEAKLASAQPAPRFVSMTSSPRIADTLLFWMFVRTALTQPQRIRFCLARTLAE